MFLFYFKFFCVSRMISAKRLNSRRPKTRQRKYHCELFFCGKLYSSNTADFWLDCRKNDYKTLKMGGADKTAPKTPRNLYSMWNLPNKNTTADSSGPRQRRQFAEESVLGWGAGASSGVIWRFFKKHFFLFVIFFYVFFCSREFLVAFLKFLRIRCGARAFARMIFRFWHLFLLQTQFYFARFKHLFYKTPKFDGAEKTATKIPRLIRYCDFLHRWHFFSKNIAI